MKEVIARECRHATYCKSTEESDYSDYHFIKEIVHYKDGSSEPSLRGVVNYKRSFYVTKKGARNHEQKKEWEKIENLDEFKSTQNDLAISIAKALGTPWIKGDVKTLSNSPFLYGSDISSTAIIKQSYADKWDKRTKYSMAVFDTETDVLHGTKEILMATVSYKSKLITVIQKSFLAGQTNAVEKIHRLANQILAKYIKDRNITLEIRIVDSEIEVVKQSIQKAHEWMPDFLAVWNIEFDMGKIIEACKRANAIPDGSLQPGDVGYVDIAEIMSDPKVPKKYQSFKFNKGPAKKTTASGQVIPIKPAARWHSVIAPASFSWMDAMCAYRHIRNGEAEESSYSLDNILTKKLKLTKLKFEQAKDYTGLKWHQFMQEQYPIEYVVYNMFDCISMEILDEATNDLSISLPMFSGCSDYEHFRSQPKRTTDKLHYHCLRNNRVVGTVSREMSTELDDSTVGLSEWMKNDQNV